MIDENELKRNLDKACDDQRDAFAASIDAAWKSGLKKGRDEQLEQVLKWLDENVSHYHYRHYYDTGECPRPSRRWDKLTAHLKEEMRPQENDS